MKQAQTHVDRLTQSLLAKAFRGELVPTEHALAARERRDYEPASALLARMRDTGETISKKARLRKKNQIAAFPRHHLQYQHYLEKTGRARELNRICC